MTEGGGDTEQEILGVALQLFCERGYDATSGADIAAALRPRRIEQQIGNKDELLQAIGAPLADALEGLVSRASEADISTDGRRKLLREYLEVLLSWRAVVCFLVDDPAVRHHHQMGGRLRELQGRLQSSLAGDGGDEAASVAAAAALGAVWRPVTSLGDDLLNEHKERILDAAMAAFDASQSNAF